MSVNLQKSNINKTLFTMAGLPVPIHSDEYIAYSSKNIAIYFMVGNGIPAYTEIYSYTDGIIFLTNYRLIYSCNDKNFKSFYTDLKKIKTIYRSGSLRIEINSGDIIDVHIKHMKNHRHIFFDELEMQMSKYIELEDTEIIVDEVPLYCDINK